MRKMFSMVAVVCLGLLAGSVDAQSPASAAEQAIRPLMAKMLQAANAHDTDAFMAAMSREPGLVFVANGQVIRGWDALHAQQLKWWKHGKSDARYREDGAPSFMALAPDVEVVTWPLASSLATGAAKTATARFVVSYVWIHASRGWQIVYGHESWAKPSG